MNIKPKQDEVQFFYYNKVWNSLVVRNNRNYRYRVELLLLDDEGRLFIGRKSDGRYTIPGGSVEPDVDNLSQVIAECEEEARITPKDVYYVNSYVQMYDAKNPLGKWMATLPVLYDGMITDVYIGKYHRRCLKYVDKKHRSAVLAEGKFVPIEEIYDELSQAHKDALGI